MIAKKAAPKKAAPKKAAPKKAAPKKAAPKKAAPKKATSGESAALALLAKLPPNTTFEEYEGLSLDDGLARRDKLVALFATPKLRKQLAKNEYFDDGGRVQAIHFDAGWIPFAEDGGGCLLCLDTHPGPKGEALQVIQWELRGGGAFVRAPSLPAFVKKLRLKLAL